MLIPFSFIILLASCASDDQPECPGFNAGAFNLDIYDESITLPGKVSVFFKAQTRDGKPIAGLTTDNFTIYEKGRNDLCFNKISSFESNASISLNSQLFGSATMLVLDLSGSVIQGSLVELKQAATSFIEQIMPELADPSYQMGIWWFDGQNELHRLSNFIAERAVLLSIIDDLDPSMTSDPSTDLYGAVIKSSDIARDIRTGLHSDLLIGTSSVVIFTDGTDQAARYSRTDAINAVKQADKSISFYSIGLGDEIDRSVLSAIGKTASIIANSKADLENKFIETSKLVYEEANSYYLFEYCSPKRDGSGVSDLAIQLNYVGQTGSALTQFNATGFTAGCQ
jgi:hypothetical protein